MNTNVLFHHTRHRIIYLFPELCSVAPVNIENGEGRIPLEESPARTPNAVFCVRALEEEE